MYVLPQAGILANKLLEQWLSARGYYQCQHTPGLWRHKWRAITFCLVVVNFGIKVTDMANFHHLKTSLKDYYEVAIDWTGLLFCGVKLTWDYKRYHANCSMPGYVDKVPASHANGTPTCTISCGSYPTWRQGPAGRYQHHFPTCDHRVETSPGHCWHPSLLPTRSQSHALGRPQCHCSTTIQWHTSHGRCMSPTT